MTCSVSLVSLHGYLLKAYIWYCVTTQGLIQWKTGPLSHQSSGGLKSSPIYTNMSTTIVFRYFLRDHSAETPWVRLL